MNIVELQLSVLVINLVSDPVQFLALTGVALVRFFLSEASLSFDGFKKLTT